MITTASDITHKLYKKAFKPILFLFKPDGLHHRLTSGGVLAGNIMPVRWLMRELWRYDNEHTLAQVVKGVYFANPIGLSAGFDKDFKLLKILPSLGFGLAECGSMTRYASSGNPRPHYHRLKKSQSIVVYAGLNNQGADVLISRLKQNQQNRKVWMPVNVSVAKTNSAKSGTTELGIADYIATLKKLKKANVGDLITINISCPNAFGGEPYTTPNRLEQLLKAIDKVALSKPIFLKMPSDLQWPEFKKLIDVALKHNISGLTICNLAKDRSSAKLSDPLPDSIKGNLSGKPTYDLSNELISKTYAYCGNKLAIIGVGGVFNALDAYEKIKRGATLVELITGIIFEGPQLIGQINQGLTHLLEADGYTHISQAIGAYNKATD